MTEPLAFPPVLNILAAEIIAHLSGSLVGLYLYGSLVVGDFDESRSDIDLLAVTRGLLAPETERAIERMQNSNSAPSGRTDWRSGTSRPQCSATSRSHSERSTGSVLESRSTEPRLSRTG